MSPTTFELPVASPAMHAATRAWLLLGLAALLLAGLYSLLLVLARTPAIQQWLPLANFFRVALVVHVDLSVLIWMLCMGGVFWSLAAVRERAFWDRFSFRIAAAGTLLVVLAPWLGASEPLLNNYVPLLRHPVFYAGLALFMLGISSQLLRVLLERWPTRVLDGVAALRLGARFGAVVTAIAVLAFLASLARTPPAMGGEIFFEFLFWGSGHVLQFSYTLLMMVAWVILACASGCAWSLSPRLTLVFLLILALPVLTVPFLYLAHEVTSPGHRLAFTELMKYGGLSCLPLGAAVLASLWRAQSPGGEARYLRVALLASMLLFAVGGVLGFLISGLDIVIPAHYHGSTVGVTIAFMGFACYLLPRLGYGPLPARLAFWQPLIYGGGQLMHIMGLAWTGGYGVQRKTAGLAQGVDRLGEVAGMGLMGLGGLVSVIGGVLFLVVAWHSIRVRRSAA